MHKVALNYILLFLTVVLGPQTEETPIACIFALVEKLKQIVFIFFSAPPPPPTLETSSDFPPNCEMVCGSK